MKTDEEYEREIFNALGKETGICLELQRIAQRIKLEAFKAGMIKAAEVAVDRMSPMTIPSEFIDRIEAAILAARDNTTSV